MSGTVELDSITESLPTFTGEVHPLAADFPMVPDAELDDLASDIAENGLRVPLTVDADGQLLDGRNRLAACERAGVEPRFDVFTGDAVSFIVSANAMRRQLSAGQRAMAIALGMWEAELWNSDKWKYGARKSIVADTTVGNADLAICGQIIAHDRTLAVEVLNGRGLRDAYDHVQAEKHEAAKQRERLDTLTDQAPDLLALVSDDKMPLAEAWAAYMERTEVVRKAQAAERAAIESINADFITTINTINTVTFDEESLRRLIDNWTPGIDTWTQDDIQDAATRLATIATKWKADTK